MPDRVRDVAPAQALVLDGHEPFRARPRRPDMPRRTLPPRGPAPAPRTAGRAVSWRPARVAVSWRTAAAIALALLVVAVMATRPATGGPLELGDPSGVVVRSFPAGAAVTYGLQTLGNSSDGQVIDVVAVEPVLGTPAPEVLGEAMLIRSAGVEAGRSTPAVRPGWPPIGTDPTPVDGQELPAGSLSHLEVLLPLEVPETGMAVVEGFAITYRVDGRMFRERSSAMLVLCPANDPVACQEFEANL